METFLNLTEIKFLLPSSLHYVMHLRLWVTFRQGSFFFVQTPVVQSKAYSPIFHPPPTLGAIHELSYTLKQDFRITLAWIPGHVGISGNEAADMKARDSQFRVPWYPQSVYLDQMATGLGTQGNKL
jgi:hypothetical protein